MNGATDVDRAILAAIGCEWRPRPVVIAEIKAATGRSGQSVAARLRSLWRRGLVERDRQGRMRRRPGGDA